MVSVLDHWLVLRQRKPWLLWRVWCLSVVVLLLTRCQPLAPPTLPTTSTSAPRFLPALASPTAPITPGTPALSLEQQEAFNAAEALRRSDQYLQARQAFADFVRRYPESALTDDALLALGHISATLEQYEPALAYYRALLERFPRSERVPEAHLGLGVAAYQKQDYPSSLRALQQYLALAPSGTARGLAHYYLGAGALKQQRPAEAVPAFKTAMDTSREPALQQQAREELTSTIQQVLSVEALAALALQYARTFPGDLILNASSRSIGKPAIKPQKQRRCNG